MPRRADAVLDGYRPIQLTDEGLIPLDHLWYRGDRVVAFVTESMGLPAVAPPGSSPKDMDEADSVSARLAQMEETALYRRWYGIASGSSEFISLPVVDRLLCVLGLFMSELGDADFHATKPPSFVSYLRGRQSMMRRFAPPTYEEIDAARAVA